ncbi:MAG: HEAT repeat domain-containing protein [Anaerolineae bacterium]
MSGSGLTDAEIQIIVRQLFEEELTPKEEERLLSQLERAEDDVLPVLRTMLRSVDPRTVDTAVTCLASWSADERTIEREIVNPLRRLIDDPDLPDRNKVAVASVLADQAAPIDPETFRAALRDPGEMIRATLRAALDQADSDMARAAFLESLGGEPLEAQIGVVQELDALDDPRAARLLAPLLYTSNDAVVRAALSALDDMLEAPAELYAALEDLATESSELAIRERASVLHKQLIPADRRTPAAPLRGAWVTSVDGDGGQMIVAARQVAPQNLIMLNVYFNDLDGIQDYAVLEGISPAELEQLLTDLEAEGVLVVEADLETCRELLADARSATSATGQPLPLSFGVWRDFLAGDDHRGLRTPALISVGGGAHEQWLPESDRLLEHPAFAYWFFDPDELPTRPIEAYQAAGTDQARQTAIDEALEAYINARLCTLVRERLRRQACVVSRLGDDDAVRRTLAAADALTPHSDVMPKEHPLLRAMMHRTLEGHFEEP